MSTSWGELPIGTVVPFIFTSHDAATGANETMSGLALSDIEVYKGVSLTQRASDAGYAFFGGDADGLDLDTFTGVNGISIDTGDDTDAGFFAAGSLYTVVLGPVTIDGQTVYTVLGTFRLVAAESVAGVKEVDLTHVAGSAVSTSAAQLGVNVVNAGGTAWASGAITAAVFAANAINAAKLDPDVATELNAGILAVLGALADAAADGDPTSADTLMQYTKQLVNVLIGTTGIVAFPTAASAANNVSLAEVIRAIAERLGTPSDLGGGATVAANLSDIEAQTDDIGAAGAGLTALATQASVNTIDDFLDTEIAAIKATTDKLDDLVLNRTTIASLASQTSFTLTAGSADNDAYNGCVIVIQDAVTAVQKAVGVVLDYTGGTKTITLKDDPAVFTMATTDIVTIIADRALKPTVDNRTLDVSAGGEGGVDWANVGTPGSTVGLSATTVATVTTATNVTTVNGLAANVITAAATNADFSTEVNAAVLAVLGALADAAADGAVTATDTLMAYTKQLINTLEGAPGMPTWPAAVAPGNGVSIAEALRYLYDQVGIAGAALTAADDAVITAVAAVQADTDNIQTRLPAALVGGRMDSSVGAMAANVLTAAAAAADFGTEIAAAVWDALTSGMVTVGSIGKKLADWVVGTIDTYTGNTPQTGDSFARIGAAGESLTAISRAINPQVNTALANLTFEMYDSTNHNPTASLTVTGQRSLDGGAYAAVTGTIAEVANGTYQIDAAAADMNGALIVFRFSAAGADDTFVHVKTAA